MAVLASRQSDDEEAVAADAIGRGGSPAQVSEIDHGFQWLRPGGRRRRQRKRRESKNRAGGEYKIPPFIGGGYYVLVCFHSGIEIFRLHARRWRHLMRVDSVMV